MGIVFQHFDSRFRGVETGSAALQNFVTSTERPLNAGAIFALSLQRHAAAVNCSGAPVNRESDFVWFHVCVVLGVFLC